MGVNLTLNISKPEFRVRTFRDLSFKDTSNIVAFSQQVFANMHNNLTIYNQKNVSQMLKRIDNSIKRRSIGRIILDIITFQFIKIFIIKTELPLLIQRINTIAANNKPDKDDDQFDPTGLEEESDYDSQVDNDSWQDNCEFKFDLLVRAFEHFTATRDKLKATAGNNPQWQKTAEEVDNFFQDRLNRLSRGENMAIPMYYHASRLGTDLIAGSSMLKQSSGGLQGAGVYYSNSDESHSGYGPCTFAMDPAQVEPFSTTYADHGGYCWTTGEERALWMCAHEDIQLDHRRVAYVIVPNDNDETLTDKINKFWRDGNFFVELITRPAADWIRTSIKAVHTHYVPKHWTFYGRGYRAATGLKNIVAN